MDFIIKLQIKMKSPVGRLLQKAFSKFNLFEFILSITSVGIGLGIVSTSSILINVHSMIQMILFLAFLEMGSQVFFFHKREYIGSSAKVEIPGEKNASLLLVILFYGISILPFSQILQAPMANANFLTLLSISTFLIIIWRNIGESAMNQIIKIFIFSFNISFLIPLTQLVFYRMNVNVLFITISQVLFLFLLGFLVMREIFHIEIEHEKSKIVQIIGTIPLIKIAATILIIGSILLVFYGVKNLKAEVILFVSTAVGLLLLILNQTIHLDRYGKLGLITIYRTTTILLIFQILGWLILLWLF
jgi:hypothetical protein